jgi:hypothetical protein
VSKRLKKNTDDALATLLNDFEGPHQPPRCLLDAAQMEIFPQPIDLAAEDLLAVRPPPASFGNGWFRKASLALNSGVVSVLSGRDEKKFSSHAKVLLNFRSIATASALDIDDLSPRLHLFSSLIVLKGASGRVCHALGLQRQDQAKYEWLAEPVLSSNMEFNFVMPSSTSECLKQSPFTVCVAGAYHDAIERWKEMKDVQCGKSFAAIFLIEHHSIDGAATVHLARQGESSPLLLPFSDGSAIPFSLLLPMIIAAAVTHAQPWRQGASLAEAKRRFSPKWARSLAIQSLHSSEPNTITDLFHATATME